MIPVEEKVIGKGGGKNLSFIVFRYDNWNGEQFFDLQFGMWFFVNLMLQT